MSGGKKARARVAAALSEGLGAGPDGRERAAVGGTGPAPTPRVRMCRLEHLLLCGLLTPGLGCAEEEADDGMVEINEVEAWSTTGGAPAGDGTSSGDDDGDGDDDAPALIGEPCDEDSDCIVGHCGRIYQQGEISEKVCIGSGCVSTDFECRIEDDVLLGDRGMRRALPGPRRSFAISPRPF